MRYSQPGVSRYLETDEFAAFKIICSQLCMPVEPAVSVETLKRTTQVDKLTGRRVDYVAGAGTSSAQASVVSLQESIFGTIQDMFVYRAMMFTVIKKIRCSIGTVFGLRRLANPSEDAVVILPIDSISRPLALARTDSDIWILNMNS